MRFKPNQLVKWVNNNSVYIYLDRRETAYGPKCIVHPINRPKRQLVISANELTDDVRGAFCA